MVLGEALASLLPRPPRRFDTKTRVALVACTWHPLAAIENAAKDGLSYDPGVQVVTTKCTGVVTVAFLLRLFAKGYDGVLVLGCADGDCHYYNGGERCKAIVEETGEILEISGIPKERLGFHQVANSTSAEFEKALKSYLKQFKDLGTGRRKLAAGSHR
ncbi:MAG TPA: hydrogenase iron-sulfur subunit [bacterium]|nr:hydrogenase iron-sulfur subunit [bacterium]